MPQPHRPTRCSNYLLLSIFLLVLAPITAQAQLLTGDQSNNLPNNLSSSLTKDTLQANADPFSGSTSSVDFLPVEQAYQLIPNVFGDQVQLQWQIADGYYLYGHNLSVSLNDEPLPLTLPAGQIRYDDYYEKELSVYYQQLQLDLPIKATSSRFTLKVNSQGCADAGLCYPPQTQFIDVDLEQQSATLQVTASRPTTQAAPQPSRSSNNDTSSMTLVSAWLLAMLGGIILNLMPCVFPVLSLKALGLANASQERQYLHGWSYTAGAVATFVAIAGVLFAARSAGEAAGWGFQLQSPVVVAVLAYLFFIMGLSLSGILHLQSRWTDLGDDLTRGHSLKASFFTGALATVVASPCTAPFMGAALGWALVQPTGIGLSVFAALGFGMALPFLLLSYLPQLSRALPKPGAWMETLKQGLAFPLYLTSVWLLWVLGRQHGSDSVALLITGMTLIGFAAWLLHTNSHQPAHLLLRRCLAVISLAIAITPLVSISRPAATETEWQTYSPNTLQQLLAQGEPVFVNLTADWCITCLANEKIALDTEATRATFERLGIHRLKGDWTNYNPAITELLSQYNRSGVPLYLLYPNGLDTQAQVLPQLLTESLVIEVLESVDHQENHKIADDQNK
jgi:thiol:disulfide interchange protein